MVAVIDREKWEKRKQEFYERMRRDREIGYLDPGIEDVLEEFFRRPGSYTTSSCSGRITLVDAEAPWVREGSTVLFRSHEPVEMEEIVRVLDKPAMHTVWFLAGGPIIHVNTYDVEEAFEILRIAREAGFKHSGIMSMSPKGVVVELTTGMNITTPLKMGERMLTDYGYIAELVVYANRVLEDGRKRLLRLKQQLVNDRLKRQYSS